MTKVALFGDRITEYTPYKIDENMNLGFNVPMISSKLSNNDITFYICVMSNVGVGTYHKYLWKDVIKDDGLHLNENGYKLIIEELYKKNRIKKSYK